MAHYNYTCDRDIIDRILQDIGSKIPETGGVLGGNRETGRITHFHFERTAVCSQAAYSPDVELLNNRVFPAWNAQHIYLMGFVHSHPGALSTPSGADLDYAERILAAVPELEKLFMPIVIPGSNGVATRIHPWAIGRKGQLHRVTLQTDASVRSFIAMPNMPDRAIVPKSQSEFPAWKTAGRAYGAAAENAGSMPAVPPAKAPSRFDRIENAYDLKRMQASRMIVVGVGGSRALVEDMARAGVGDFVLIDPDTYTATNIGTQQAYRDEIGMAKVDAVAVALHRIDPSIRVEKICAKLEDIDDRKFKRLLDQPHKDSPAFKAIHFDATPRMDRERILLAGFTDSFAAQARVNRLGLQFGIATLCGQVYQEGRGAEVTFTVPGYTQACNRCALAGRYKAYADGYKNAVTSHGTPIFAAPRINSLLGFVALAVLHRGSTHPRWGRMLERIGQRNLIQIRMDPDIAETLGLSVFDKAFGKAERVLFDDVVWLPQDADHPSRNGLPVCPDCGGTGDLNTSAGRFRDTVPMEGGRKDSDTAVA